MEFESRLCSAGWDPLSASLFREMVESNPSGTAVFDADGTLWEEIAEKHFSEPPPGRRFESGPS